MHTYAMRKDGLSIRQTGARLNRPYSTIRDWPVRAAVGRGMMGRHGEAGPGPPCKPDAAQLARLVDELIAGPRSCGFESGVWTAPLVVRHVKETYGVEYADRGMYDLLHRIGFSCRRPRPRHPKSASESQIRAFKKKPDAWQGTRPLAQLTQFDHFMQIYSQQDPKLTTFLLFYANIQKISQKTKAVPVIYRSVCTTV